MTYSTLQIVKKNRFSIVKIWRPEANNSINTTLIQELLSYLREVERDDAVRVLVIEGTNEVFCTGMDFNAVGQQQSDAFAQEDSSLYYQLLSTLMYSSKIIISKIDGRVNAGGIGIVAASDINIGSEQSTYGLSEALFGLMPACVMPFLIRRTGVQKAQWLTLITKPIDSGRAYEIGLIDEKTDDTSNALRTLLLRLTKLETATIKMIKNYTSKLWIIREDTRDLAVNQLNELLNSGVVQENISNYVNKGQFPWER